MASIIVFSALISFGALYRFGLVFALKGFVLIAAGPLSFLAFLTGVEGFFPKANNDPLEVVYIVCIALILTVPIGFLIASDTIFMRNPDRRTKSLPGLGAFLWLLLGCSVAFVSV